MTRTRTLLFPLILAAAIAVIATSMTRRALASDETQDTELTIQAVLDATSCDTVPPTITLLGLTIDVSTARIEAPGTTSSDPTPSATPEPGDDGNHHHGGGSTDPLPGGCYYCPTPPSTPVPTPTAPSLLSAAAGCTALIVGQPVEVKLANDSSPLTAAAVKQDENGDTRVKIEAPLQEITPETQTIALLGLTINVAGAELDGADDDSSDGNSQAIDLSQLITGQFVEARLASGTVPLSATELEVKNFSNTVEMQVTDDSGDAVNDVDDDGTPVNDLEIHITETVAVQNPAAATPRRVKKVLHLHTTSNGTVVLNGLATGHAAVEVTRVHNGEVTHGRRRLAVRSNASRRVRVRLH